MSAYRVLNTADELHDLSWQMGTVIQEIHTGECCEEKFCDFYQPLWEMAFQCGWTRAGQPFEPEGPDPRLPVRVLFDPSDDDPVPSHTVRCDHREVS